MNELLLIVTIAEREVGICDGLVGEVEVWGARPGVPNRRAERIRAAQRLKLRPAYGG